jgi:uncharacterized protein (DUF58 family)
MTNHTDNPRRFFDPRTLAELHGLQLRARHIVEGYVAGLHRSPLHGFSIEFAEHREYSTGDDLRHLDWKAFGRTDKFYLKQYEDESNLICYLVLDVSESMSYQSQQAPLSKLQYAQCVAASLAWLVLHQQDAVGLATIDRQLQSFVRPSTNASHLRQIISTLESVSAESKTAIGATLHQLAQRLTKRGVVVILSDLFDDVASLLAGLKHFRHRRHDVIVLHVLDPAELDFPFQRPTLFQGLEQWPELTADPQGLRKAYLQQFGQFLSQVRRGCRAQQVDYQLLRTDQTLDVALSRYLAKRMAYVK